MSEKCECGNPEYGFDCVCKHVAEYPGEIEYGCEYCGLYAASRPRCNKCEAEEDLVTSNNKEN